MTFPREYYNDVETKCPSPRRRRLRGGGGIGEGDVGMIPLLLHLLLFLLPSPASPFESYRGGRHLQEVEVDGITACAGCPNDGSRTCVGRTIDNSHCLPCATGQTWWPCNILYECHCGSVETSTASLSSASGQNGMTACADCPNDGVRDCIATSASIGDAQCAQCATGQAWWPCDLVDECHCGSVETSLSSPTRAPSVPATSSVETSTASLSSASGQNGMTACADCPNDGVRNCIATSASIGDAHCAQCATGQAWWPCDLVDECHCSGSPPTSSPTRAPSVPATSSPTTSRADEDSVAVAAAKPWPAIVPGSESPNVIVPQPVALTAANALVGMRVVDAHLSANKVAISRELLLGSSSFNDGDLSYAGFRSALRSMIATSSSSSLQSYQGFGMGVAGMRNLSLYVGEMEGNNGRAYGLVNVALFLAMSTSESITRGGCDEVNVEFVEFDGVLYLPAMNACGQGGMDYTDMGCRGEEEMYDCPVDKKMRMTAGPLTPGTSFVDGSTPPKPLYCRPPDSGGEDEGVEGCCWWGRGSIRLRGTCAYGKLNYFLGKRAHDEGRPSLYPDIDFCSNPQAVCSERGRHPELPWTAGLFRWVTEIQPYNADGFDYLTRLRDFVDGGLRDGSFALAVAGIVATGCHAPPCSKGWGGGVGGGAAFDGSDRVATFAKTLSLLGLPAEFDASS